MPSFVFFWVLFVFSSILKILQCLFFLLLCWASCIALMVSSQIIKRRKWVVCSCLYPPSSSSFWFFSCFLNVLIFFDILWYCVFYHCIVVSCVAIMVSLQIVEKKKSMVHSCACLLLVFFHDFLCFKFFWCDSSYHCLQQVVCREFFLILGC